MGSYTGSSDKGNIKCELGGASKLSFMEELQENNNNSIGVGEYGNEGQEFINVERINNDSVVSSEKWFGGGSFNSGGLLDPSTSSVSQWLNFWPVWENCQEKKWRQCDREGNHSRIIWEDIK